MKTNIFVIFHKKIYKELYPDDTTNIIFYGVNENIEKDIIDNNFQVTYEYKLPIYNRLFQMKTYNESSSFYHIYKNKLYEDLDYIGFAQYDMKFFNDTFTDIEKIVKESDKSYIFYIFKTPVLDYALGRECLIKNIDKIDMNAIDSYNKFFNKSYNVSDIFGKYIVKNNTFVIPKWMYIKMMTWFEQLMREDIDFTKLELKWENSGHVMEILVGLFLHFEYMEGAEYKELKVKHEWPIYKNISY